MKLKSLFLLGALMFSTAAMAIDEARTALDEWRPDRALEILDASPDEQDAHWHRLRGVALMNTGQTEESFTHLERAVELAPEEAEGHWFMLMGLTARLEDAGMFGKLRLARRIGKTLETAVELDPDNPEYRFGLLQYYLQAPGIAGGSSSGAREQRDALAEMDPKWGLAAEAIFLLVEEENEAALEKMLAAWDDGDGVQEVAMPIVFNAQGQEDWATARRVLDRLLADEPGKPSVLYQVGRTAALSGEELEAGLKALETYADLPFIGAGDPSRAAAFWRMGQIHRHAGEPVLARQAWNESLEHNPEFDDAQQSLAELDKEMEGDQS